MKPLVSILIPAYNAGGWIDETIQSGQNQTWPRKELIIVNDGSRDDTESRARRYESPMVKVVSQQNRGASAARNHALSLAQGDYIQWLDSDDLLAPNKIAVQLECKPDEQTDTTLLSSEFGEFYFNPTKASFRAHALWQDLLPQEWIRLKFLNSNFWMAPCTWLVSRRLTELAGAWEEQLSLDDDGEYFCRLVSRSTKVLFIPGARSYYRLSNMASLSKIRSRKAYESLLMSTSLCIGHLLSLEDSERNRDACLRYLQSLYYQFYAGNGEPVLALNEMARELGGALTEPQLRREYFLVRTLFGWKAAATAMRWIRMIKLRAGIIREWCSAA